MLGVGLRLEASWMGAPLGALAGTDVILENNDWRSNADILLFQP
jgi:hypothetical protein